MLVVTKIMCKIITVSTLAQLLVLALIYTVTLMSTAEVTLSVLFEKTVLEICLLITT